jgi:EAL domain-containing protein (putative c-di-GMP-specific phosphodiesterase class I)
MPPTATPARRLHVPRRVGRTPALADVLRAGVERGAEGFLLLDRAGGVRFANAAAERILGRGLAGRPLPELRESLLAGEGELRLGARWYRVRSFAHPAGTGVLLLDVTAERAGGAARARADLAADLRRALSGGELSLVFQPVVELATGRAVGAEALARWRHPELGPVEPAEFVPLAEDTGTIGALGEWVMAEACRALPALDAALGPRSVLSINVSAHQLAGPGVAARMRAALHASGADPRRVAVEITESALLARLDEAGRTLAELRACGVRVYLDDFGTGYSSLSYLHRLPVDGIKIDRSFVHGLPADERSRHLVASIVGLARALDVQVVAEGVDDAAQVDVLRALGCGYAQGFLFSHPVPADRLGG